MQESACAWPSATPNRRRLPPEVVEEGIDMAARVRMSLGLIGPILGHPGIEVRVHDTPAVRLDVPGR